MKNVSNSLKEHYENRFELHGPSSKGVDWGENETNLNFRYQKMIAVLPSQNTSPPPTLLDVGCGFGGLLHYANSMGIDFCYSGIDIAANMVEWARKNYPNNEFCLGDILKTDFNKKYDYVICNGILTQKLETPGLIMDVFAHKLIKRLYDLCNIGIAFNVMTTKVNYFSNNLYYRNPVELFAWCISEISPHIKIDHSYPLYEYTVYVYRNAE